MRVLVTGGTGFVGSHSVAALVQAGHRVRLLVRDPERVARSLAWLGLGPLEHCVGDVTDLASVERALEGCEAVLHAAAVASLSPRRAREVEAVNVGGTALVLGAARRRGLDPIVHVSSLSALLPADTPRLHAEADVQHPALPYSRSKAEAERVARALQAGGAPLVITYPGGVWGPGDPYAGEGTSAVLRFVKLGFAPCPASGGLPLVDVRDVAALHAALLVPGRGPRRYMAGGPFVTARTLGDAFERVTGRHVRTPRVPGALMRGVGRVGDWSRHLGFSHGLTREAMVTLTRGVPCDDAPTTTELGVGFRPLEETLHDTLAWLRAEGRSV